MGTRADTITVRLSAHDSGCLPGLLRHQIEVVQRTLRACGDGYSAEDKAMALSLIAQMRSCLEAVEAARAEWVNGRSRSRVPG
jgi:hypothetical protein